MKWVTVIQYVTPDGELIENYTKEDYRTIKKRVHKVETGETMKKHIIHTVIKRPYKQTKLW